MRAKGVAAALLVATTLIAIAMLLSGEAWLAAPLPGGLPAGNVLAAHALCAPPAAAAILARHDSVLRKLATGVLVLGLAWLPLSLLVAGNPELNFGDARGPTWIQLSLALGTAAYGVLAWALGASALAMRRRRRR